MGMVLPATPQLVSQVVSERPRLSVSDPALRTTRFAKWRCFRGRILHAAGESVDTLENL